LLFQGQQFVGVPAHCGHKGWQASHQGGAGSGGEGWVQEALSGLLLDAELALLKSVELVQEGII
jgi:hypothetical protein